MREATMSRASSDFPASASIRSFVRLMRGTVSDEHHRVRARCCAAGWRSSPLRSEPADDRGHGLVRAEDELVEQPQEQDRRDQRRKRR
jgi:hypothetical protein